MTTEQLIRFLNQLDPKGGTTVGVRPLGESEYDPDAFLEIHEVALVANQEWDEPGIVIYFRDIA